GGQGGEGGQGGAGAGGGRPGFPRDGGKEPVGVEGGGAAREWEGGDVALPASVRPSCRFLAPCAGPPRLLGCDGRRARPNLPRPAIASPRQVSPSSTRANHLPCAGPPGRCDGRRCPAPRPYLVSSAPL